MSFKEMVYKMVTNYISILLSSTALHPGIKPVEVDVEKQFTTMSHLFYPNV